MEDLTRPTPTQSSTDPSGPAQKIEPTLGKDTVTLPPVGAAIAPPTEPVPTQGDKGTSHRLSPLKVLLGMTFNLLGLATAGTLSLLGGMAIAQFYPAPVSEDPPLLERVLDQGGRSLSTLQHLPKTAAQGLANRLNPMPKPQLEAAAPILTETQQQQIGNEIATLQNELAQMDARTSALEKQLGYEYSGAAIALRLQALAQTVANPSAGPQSVANRDRTRQPLLVTLPLDPLFEESQSLLKPASTVLLGAIISELRAYPAGIVTIGVHADDVGEGPAKRDLSLRRAQSVAQYIQAQVGDASNNRPSNRFLWNLVGYGDSEPLAPNDSNENRQRNRRLEVQVTPR
ncbi:MAG: OmpA family protein [Synechococcales cyanobacterium CRU_2_2]|nr:OmpA family protein [Synechococcales cyanobacterium CRU_2_2]